MIYVLFAVFMGFVGSVIFKDGLFANALFCGSLVVASKFGKLWQ